MYKVLFKSRTTNYSLIFGRHNLATKISSKIDKADSTNVEEKNLRKETVVVTNASAGIGLSLAVKLAQLHANVGIWDNDEQTLKDAQNFAKSNLGVDLAPFVCDMTKKDEIYKTAEKTKKELGPVTTIINTVTQSSETLFLDTPDDLLESVFQSNVLSQLWLTKAFLPNMIQTNSGRLITISSMAGHMGVHKLVDYCVSNAAAINFMTALRAELDNEGASGIKTTVVCPYFVKSCNLHKHTKIRLLRAVSKEEVAERTVRAILNNESMVFLPRWFKYSATLRWLCPVSVSKFFKNLLIKDLNSRKVPKPLVEMTTGGYMTALDNPPDKSVCDLSGVGTQHIAAQPEKNNNKEV